MTGMSVSGKKMYYLIVCEIMFREACACAAKSRSVVDIAFMPKKLHDLGEAKMSEALQRQIDQVDAEKYDAILLCYGLCNYGVRSLHAEIPIVIPRAHDCIALLMGSRDKYAKYFDDNPGTFFHSTGWIERDTETEDGEGIASQLGIDKSYEEYVELYGEEDAKYVVAMLDGWKENYKKVAYIDTGIGDQVYDIEFSKRYAKEKKWEFEELQGNIGLILNLLEGEWNEHDFLVVPPSRSIQPSYDADIIRCSEGTWQEAL
jgi:hypothetical protein